MGEFEFFINFAIEIPCTDTEEEQVGSHRIPLPASSFDGEEI